MAEIHGGLTPGTGVSLSRFDRSRWGNSAGRCRKSQRKVSDSSRLASRRYTSFPQKSTPDRCEKTPENRCFFHCVVRRGKDAWLMVQCKNTGGPKPFMDAVQRAARSFRYSKEEEEGLANDEEAVRGKPCSNRGRTTTPGNILNPWVISGGLSSSKCSAGNRECRA